MTESGCVIVSVSVHTQVLGARNLPRSTPHLKPDTFCSLLSSSLLLSSLELSDTTIYEP